MSLLRFILFSFLSLVLLVGTQSCRPNKILANSKINEKVNDGVNILLDRSLNNFQDEISFTYLKSKSKVEWKIGDEVNNYIVDFRAKKDSIIWFNVSVSLISGGTGIFTQDKVEFLDKIHGKYYNLGYDSLSSWLGIEVSFNEIQNVLVGNKPFSKKNLRVNRQNENFLVQQNEDQINIDSYFGPNRKLNKLKIKDNLTKNELEMDLSDFVKINQVLFPFSNDIILNVFDKENKPIQTSIRIKYSKVELLETPLSFNFNVPEKYLNKNAN